MRREVTMGRSWFIDMNTHQSASLCLPLCVCRDLEYLEKFVLLPEDLSNVRDEY
jgi:hypothetical protein